MIYNHANCHNRTQVYDVDTKERITYVMSVDTDEMLLTVALVPTKWAGDRVASEPRQYTTIYPIFGGSPWPVMFHCYGRKN